MNLEQGERGRKKKAVDVNLLRLLLRQFQEKPNHRAAENPSHLRKHTHAYTHTQGMGIYVMDLHINSTSVSPISPLIQFIFVIVFLPPEFSSQNTHLQRLAVLMNDSH